MFTYVCNNTLTRDGIVVERTSLECFISYKVRLVKISKIEMSNVEGNGFLETSRAYI